MFQKLQIFWIKKIFFLPFSSFQFLFYNCLCTSFKVYQRNHMKTKKVILIFGAFTLSVLISFYTVSIFGTCKNLEFYAYDGLALVMGFTIAFLSYFLMKKEQGHRYFHYLGILIGLVMIGTHLTKLFIGRCV